MPEEKENVTETDETQVETEAIEPTAEVENAPEAEVDAVSEAAEEAPAEPADAPEAEPMAAEAEPVVEAEEEAATEPVAEAEPEAAEEPAGEAAEPAAVAAPEEKRKKKRLPRSERPQRTKKSREKATERKPITRLTKPEHARGRRQERQGTVVSAAADKTIVVRVDVVKVHPTYKKVVRRSTKFHAHDERNEAKPGDVVRIVETRPLSKLKRWRLQEIVEAAK